MTDNNDNHSEEHLYDPDDDEVMPDGQSTTTSTPTSTEICVTSSTSVITLCPVVIVNF
jgi:hypothetical protein